MGRTLGVVVLTVATGLAVACAVPANPVEEPADCRVTVQGYDGPCPLGALPAFFDDFRYDSGRTSGSVVDAPPGDIFGENVWMTEGGPEATRAWYRFNRNNHTLTGSITFEDGVMRLLVPRGTRAEDFTRSLILHTGATFESGTYHYRVRLGPLWEGQQLRQTAWAMSPDQVVFETTDPDGKRRYEFWSEIDFENQNHFQGSRETGQFVPDFITMMSVGNHYGVRRRQSRGPQAMSAIGPVDYMAGRGALARDGFARNSTNRSAPLVSDWSEIWLDLLIHVDSETRETTYRMQPVTDEPMLQGVARRPVRIGDAFYPRRPMHFAFSLHWLDRSDRLRDNFWIEVDWIFHSPVSGLSSEFVSTQIDHFRAHGLSRVNTTGRPTFQDHNVALRPRIEGPDQIACGVDGTWDLIVNRSGALHASLRVRSVDRYGRVGAWEEVPDITVSLQPDILMRQIEIEATLTDRWRPNGVVIDAITEWQYPAEGNTTATTTKTIAVVCDQ